MKKMRYRTIIVLCLSILIVYLIFAVPTTTRYAGHLSMGRDRGALLYGYDNIDFARTALEIATLVGIFGVWGVIFGKR